MKTATDDCELLSDIRAAGVVVWVEPRGEHDRVCAFPGGLLNDELRARMRAEQVELLCVLYSWRRE